MEKGEVRAVGRWEQSHVAACTRYGVRTVFFFVGRASGEHGRCGRGTVRRCAREISLRWASAPKVAPQRPQPASNSTCAARCVCLLLFRFVLYIFTAVRCKRRPVFDFGCASSHRPLNRSALTARSCNTALPRTSEHEPSQARTAHA